MFKPFSLYLPVNNKMSVMSEKPTKEHSEESEEKKEFSPEELKAARAKQQKFYKDQIPFLKTENQFWELQATIEESKARRMRAMQMQIQMSNPPTPAQPDNEEVGADGFPLSWSQEEKEQYIKDSKNAINEMEEAIKNSSQKKEETTEENQQEKKKERKLAEN